MTSYFAEIVGFVAAHPHYALIAIFLLALSEAIPVIGTVVPGSTLIIGISAVATGADVSPWLLLVAATVGAICGDGLSFWFGQRYHREILLAWPLNRYPQFIDRSEAFVKKIRRRRCLSGALRSGSARLRAAGCRHPRDVAAPVLCRQYSVGHCLGAGPRLSWRAAWHSDQPRRRQRVAGHDPPHRRADHSIGRRLGNTLVLEPASFTSQAP
jgi:hypothetical protein